MANDFGPSVWIASQYERFFQGLDAVGTGEAKKMQRANMPRVQLDNKEPRISIPAWDDVIKTGARIPVTDEDWAIHRHFEQAGLPSPLAPEVQQSIADRRAIAQRIANSAIPEYQRGVSDMLTAVDNVQDAALTFGVAGRLAGSALGRWGLFLLPATAVIGTVASVLNWLGLGLVAFGILYALACQGPRAAIAAASVPWYSAGLFKGVRQLIPRARGIAVPTAPARLKGRGGAAMFGVPSGRAVANHRASRWAKASPTFGELLQIGQSAYDWTGYGIALGGVMGLIGETAYAQERLERGERVVVRSPEVNHVYARILKPVTIQLGKGALWHREQCARALASAPIVLRDPWTFGDQMYGLSWIVVYACVEPLAWDSQGLPWRGAVIKALRGAGWPPPDARDTVTRAHVRELGKNPDDQAWPVTGSPRELTVEQLVLEVGPEIGRVLRRWLDEAPEDPWRRFIAELAMRTTERLWVWLEGTDDFPSWKLAPVTLVWESLFAASRWPIVSDPPDKLLAAWAASELAAADRGGKMLDAAELDRIWEAHGVPLLRLKVGQAPPPPEMFLPYDETTGAPGPGVVGANLAEAQAKQQAFAKSSGA